MARPRRTGVYVESEVLRHWRTQVAGAAGFGLWTAAMAWSDENLTDGHVPVEAAYRLLPGARAAAKRVTKAGFWSECMDHPDCFTLHRYAEDGRGRPRQPTRARLEAEREKQRERDARKRVPAGFPGESRRESAGNPPGTTREPDPLDIPSSHEVPPLSPPQGGEPQPSAAAPRRSTPPTTARKVRLPASWAPIDRHEAFTAEHRLDLGAEALRFREHHEFRGTLGVDWNRGFDTWLRNAVKFRDADAARTAPPQDKLSTRKLREFT